MTTVISGWYPDAVRVSLTTDGKPRDNRTLKAHRINLHTAVYKGKSLKGIFADGPFSHFYVREDGTVEQYQNVFLRAAADLEGNDNSISIETWGMGVEPWTVAQLRSLSSLLRWLWTVNPQIPRKIAASNKIGAESWGLSWHRLGVPGFAKYGPASGGVMYSRANRKTCPGDKRIAQIPGLFKGLWPEPSKVIKAVKNASSKGPDMITDYLKTGAYVPERVALERGSFAYAWVKGSQGQNLLNGLDKLARLDARNVELERRIAELERRQTSLPN